MGDALTALASKRRVAFLRGINVGGHRLTMDELRAALAPLELDDLQTFIASGNVGFGDDSRTSAELEGGIEAHLSTSLGYEVDTFIRTIPALEAVADFATAETRNSEWKPQVMFGRAAPTASARRALATLETAEDLFRFHDREIVWLRKGGLSESSIKAHHLSRALEKKPVTTRTLKTVQRILKKWGGG